MVQILSEWHEDKQDTKTMSYYKGCSKLPPFSSNGFSQTLTKRPSDTKQNIWTTFYTEGYWGLDYEVAKENRFYVQSNEVENVR